MKSGFKNFRTFDLMLSNPALFWDLSYRNIKLRSVSSKFTSVKNAREVEVNALMTIINAYSSCPSKRFLQVLLPFYWGKFLYC